jgi:hypothetical protein
MSGIAATKGASPLSVEENVSIARRFFAEQDRRKGPLADELCAPGYTVYVAGFPPMDLAGHLEFAKAFYAAFPDLKHTIDDGFANEEKAVLRFTITGTHQGELIGLAPTEKQITISGMAMFHSAGAR